MSAHFFSLELELPGLSNEVMPICHISYCVLLIKPILSHITEKEPTTGFALRHHFSPRAAPTSWVCLSECLTDPQTSEEPKQVTAQNVRALT